jgi:hypothetical protein
MKGRMFFINPHFKTRNPLRLESFFVCATSVKRRWFSLVARR